MSKKAMEQHAKGWKSPAQRADEKREKSSAPPPKGKDTKDAKGAGPNDWKKGLNKFNRAGC